MVASRPLEDYGWPLGGQVSGGVAAISDPGFKDVKGLATWGTTY